MEILWPLPITWNTKKLSEVAEEESQQVVPNNYPQENFNYWGLDVLENGQRTEPIPNIVKGSDIHSTCVKFSSQHVLYSKLRPYLNKVITPSQNGIGTTEWIVIRPNQSIIDRKYLAYVLRSPLFVSFATRNSKGARLPRISKTIFWRAEIPLPYPERPEFSLKVQRQIVARIEALLSEVREMREINQNINRDSSQLLAAILKETFPDPQKQAPDQWIWEPLGNRCKTTSGGTPRRGIQDYFNGSIPWIKSGELNDGVIIESEEKITQLAIERSNAKLFPVGTLLIAMYGATIGKLGILGLEAATNQAVCAIFPPPEILPEYLFWYLRRLRKELIYGSFGGAQPNISQTVIRKIQIPIPFYKDIEKSKTEQLRIVDYLKSISEEIVQIQKLSIHDRNLISQLEQSVLAQAFRGEL